MFRLSRMRHGPEEMDVFRPWTRYTYQSGSVYKQNFLIRQLMAVVKNKKEASKSALFNQKRLAKERSNLYSNRSIKDRPIWLNEVRGQDISGQQPIRLEPYSYGKSQRTDQLDIYSGGKFASGRTIRKRLAANSINGYFSKPHVDGWFSDEKTLRIFLGAKSC